MSISRSQAQAIATGFLNNLGTSRSETVTGEDFPIVEQILITAARDFVITATKKLDAAGAVATGNLAGIVYDVTNNAGTYTLSVGYPKGSKPSIYWDYVNKGVASLSGTGAPGSPYKFRTPKISPRMAAAILSWYRQQGRGATNVREPRTGTLGKLERKRKTLKDTIKAAPSLSQLAYATSSAIKKKGLAPTHYFDDAFKEEFGQLFREALAVAMGAEIILELRTTSKKPLE